jgi:hypothetical protein
MSPRNTAIHWCPASVAGFRTVWLCNVKRRTSNSGAAHMRLYELVSTNGAGVDAHGMGNAL